MVFRPNLELSLHGQPKRRYATIHVQSQHYITDGSHILHSIAPHTAGDKGRPKGNIFFPCFPSSKLTVIDKKSCSCKPCLNHSCQEMKVVEGGSTKGCSLVLPSLWASLVPKTDGLGSAGEQGTRVFKEMTVYKPARNSSPYPFRLWG